MIYKLELIPGRACNFRCSYCYENARFDSYGKEIMSLEVMDSAFEYAKFLRDTVLRNKDYLQVSIYGGEPFLYRDTLMDAVRTLSPVVDYFHIVTNGSLFTDTSFIDKLVKIASISFTWSYDFSLQEIQRNIMPDRVEKNIKDLSREGIKIDTNTVFSKDTLREFSEVLESWHTSLIEDPRLYSKFRFGFDKFTMDSHSLNESEIRKSFRKAKEYMFKNNIPISDMLYKYAKSGWQVAQKSFFIGNSTRMNPRQFNCGYGWRVLGCVDTDGSLYGCQGVAYDPYRDSLRIGYINEEPWELFTKWQDHSNMAMKSRKTWCPECTKICSICPLTSIKEGLLESFGGLIKEDHCTIHTILDEFLGGSK